MSIANLLLSEEKSSERLAQRHWAGLTRFFEDRRLELDTNSAGPRLGEVGSPLRVGDSRL